ncbi:MAG: PLP-dependent aminotransferase family protein [Eubacteriales bacterium]|nr:PLP-dependent aminotransferase family protein [Eubacteriales bacterium]
MKTIFPELDHNSKDSLYTQLFKNLKQEILCGNIAAGERLPSLRALSKQLGISVTTVQAAYYQLQLEGYIRCRPQSGYYAEDIHSSSGLHDIHPETGDLLSAREESEPAYRADLDSFDFGKWKKCMSRILNDYPEMLLSAADRQGEPILREEISRYVFQSRGVRAKPSQIVIGAGTQQLMNRLSRILRILGIDMISTEDPGYLPVQNIFRDNGFGLNRIPMREDGITIERLPENVSTAVYITPSNQFPTGSVMPVGRRYQILEWAKNNRSIIIEDDYDSELRYFGKPVPALQGLSDSSSVVYLGSFTATLFPAIRISYMILPENMAAIFQTIRDDYDQSCSKTEQLTLALFMENGYYQTHIRKLRNLYARKLRHAEDSFRKCGQGFIRTLSHNSGMNLLLEVHTSAKAEALVRSAKALRLSVQDVSGLTGGRQTGSDASGLSSCLSENKNSSGNTSEGMCTLLFNYYLIPLSEIESAVRSLTADWKKLE